MLEFPVGDEFLSVGVDVGTGGLKVETVGMVLPGVTEPLVVGAAYDSKQHGEGAVYEDESSHGPGWSTLTGRDVRLVEHDNGNVSYLAAGGNVSLFTADGGGGYESPAETRADLAATTSPVGWELRWQETGGVETFDASGRLASVADRNGNEVTVGYDGGSDRMTTITGSGGPVGAREVEVDYLPGGDLRVAGYVRQVPGEGPVEVTYGYAGSPSRLVSITDAEGRTTGFGYDGRGALTSITNPAGDETVFTVDSSFRVTSVTQVTDPVTGQGSTTRFLYEPDLTRVADANTDLSDPVDEVAHSIYELDATRRVVTAIDPDGNDRSTTYTAFFDVAESTNAVGGTTVNTFGANGGRSMTESVSPTGSVTEFEYGNVPAVQNPMAAYQVSSTTNPRGDTTLYRYNAFGNQEATEDPMAAEATLDHNTDGTVATSTTPLGGETDYVYNADGQLIRIEPPTGSSLGDTLYTYDARGRVATIDTGNGTPTTYGYDELDRVVSESTGDSAVDVTYTYDNAGNLIERDSHEGTTTYYYDEQHRVVQIDRPAGGTTWYGYDPVGNLVTLTDARGTTSYVYDDRNLLVEMTIPEGAGTQTSVFDYDDEGRRTHTWHAVANPASPDTGYAMRHVTVFDDAGRIRRLTTHRDSGAAVVQDVSYCYATGVAPGHNTCPTSASAADTDLIQWQYGRTPQGEVYTYDGAGRLLEAMRDEMSEDFNRYTYDANGNRTSETSSQTPYISTIQTASFNAANQIVQTSTAATGTPPVVETYTYDQAGNLTSGHTSYGYNSANQMTDAGTATDVTYDGADQNERTRAGSAAAGYTTYTNGLLGVEAYSIDTLTIDIDRDPATGQPIALTIPTGADAGVHYYATDHIGSVIGLVSDTGDRTATYTYDPYKETSRTGPIADLNLITYANGIGDTETGLIKFGARYYDPTTGRWTQQDLLNTPLDPHNANRYTYAACNPINYTDPTGHNTCVAIGAAVAAMGTLVGGIIGIAATAAVQALGAVVSVSTVLATIKPFVAYEVFSAVKFLILGVAVSAGCES